MKNIILVALTIFFSGISVFFRKLAVDKIHPYQIQIIAGIVYAIELPIWLYLMKRENITSYNTTGILYGVICILTLVCGAVILSYLMKTTASPGTLAVLVSTSPLVTLLLSVVFLGEEFTFKKLIGCISVVIGIGLLK